MFSYSFLAMTAYNMVQPITRSKFIAEHGAENLPYVVLASIVLIALLMQGYSQLGRLMPGRWIIPITQGVMVGLLMLFWALYVDPTTDTGTNVGTAGTSADAGVGRHGTVLVRPDLRDPPHYPVLDAGQHHF